LPDRIIVGRLSGAFGVKGEVRLKSFCAEPADIAGYAPLFTPDGRTFPRLRITGEAPGALTARVEGVGTREEAEALKGTDLLADRARLPALDEDEFYHADLVGLAVVDGAGRPLGVVRAVLNHGAGDILEVERPPGASGGGTLLLPFTLAVVPVVDVAGGRIVADPPEDA
jgi:16S rRNA processing protein RimM